MNHLKIKKTAVLVLTHKSHPFDFMEQCIRETWGSVIHPSVKIWFYYGDSDNFEIQDNNIFCPYDEGYVNIGRKTICAFEYLLTTDFDYIFRPNSSSYVNIDKLYEFTQTLPTSLVYSGSSIPYDTVGECCSGCGFFLSRDLVEMIVRNKEKWNHSLIDDIALCELLFELNVKMVSSPRLKILNAINGELYGLEGLIKDIDLLDAFHITSRGKENVPVPDNYREINCNIMKTLHSKYMSIKPEYR